MEILYNEFKKGVICLFTGPMFAGKTTKLIEDYRRSINGGQKSLVFHYKKDIRYSEENKENYMFTHAKTKIESFPILNSIELLNKYLEEEKIKHTKNIFIDEIQFLDSEILNVIKTLQKDGTSVYCSGLLQTSYGTAFPFSDFDKSKKSMLNLVEICDEIQTFTACCYICGKPGTKTQKLKDTGNTVDIGGKDLYRGCCIDHWTPRK